MSRTKTRVAGFVLLSIVVFTTIAILYFNNSMLKPSMCIEYYPISTIGKPQKVFVTLQNYAEIRSIISGYDIGENGILKIV